MSLFNGIKWPYATMQQLNLDWIMDKVKVLNDTGWIDIPNTAVHYRKKSGYVVVAFDGTSATSFSGSADWEIVAQLPVGYRPDRYCFSTLGAGGHFSAVIGSGYVDANGNVGIFFPQQTADIAGYIMFPVSE